MDKIEQFITQSKINHLKRLGLCPNDDDEYQELLHQIEQKEEKKETLRNNYDILCLISNSINDAYNSYLHDDDEYRELLNKSNEIKKEMKSVRECACDKYILFNHDTWRKFGFEKALNEYLLDDECYKKLKKQLESIEKKRKTMEEEGDIIYDYISNLENIEKSMERNEFELVHSSDSYEEIDLGMTEVDNENLEYLKNIPKEIKDLQVKNKEIKDQFFAIIQKKGHLLHITINDEDEEEIDLYKFFKNYKTTNWKEYYDKQLEEEKNKYINEYGHWYLKGGKIVLDISDEEYEKICKISPPFLFRIEECIQEVYNKGYNEGHGDGYNEGHEDGYNEGYNNGYDDGYRMGD